MTDYSSIIDKALIGYLPDDNCLEKELIHAMKYSLQAGGKRIRPSLCLEFCKVCGGKIELAIPFACAVEIIHTYSLIHDDLPCMDDDDYRRGKKSNHIVYGEDIALLAGDALQSLAFETALNSDTINLVGSEKAARCAGTLAKYCGTLGMVGGQVIDLQNENKKAAIEVLYQMDLKKTAAIIKASCEMGCICAGADKSQIHAASLYGEYIGIAFQIVDDMLDVTSTQEQLGKPTGSDISNNKSTYVSLLGIKGCTQLVNELTQKAIDCLNVFSSDTTSLAELAVSLKTRKN